MQTACFLLPVRASTLSTPRCVFSCQVGRLGRASGPFARLFGRVVAVAGDVAVMRLVHGRLKSLAGLFARRRCCWLVALSAA